MVLRSLLKGVSEAFAPGTSRARLNAAIAIVIAVLGSAAILLLPPYCLLPTLIFLAMVAVFLRGFKVLSSVMVAIAPFILAYVGAGLLIQYVMNALEPTILVVSSARVLSMALLSVIVISSVRVTDLIALMSKFSPALAISVALALKSVHTISLSLARLQEIHSINIGHAKKGLKGKIIYVETLAKALAFSSILTMLQVSEALYTRYPAFVRRLKGVEG